MSAYVPQMNKALEAYLANLRENPDLINPNQCCLPGCRAKASMLYQVLIYRPDVPGHPTTYFNACSNEHHRAVIEYFGLRPFAHYHLVYGYIA